MNTFNLSSDFAAQFAASSLSSLVDSFNRQVGSCGWASARAAHDRALMDELRHRGIDVSAVSDGCTTSFAHHVALQDNALVVID